MAMTLRERLLTVLRGDTPDVVPWFPDLSNWFNSERSQKFVPSGDKEIDYEMIDLYKEVEAGIYIELGGILQSHYDGNVREFQNIEDDIFTWTLKTPIGELQEIRIYNETSSSWDIKKRMVQNVDELEIIQYAMKRKNFVLDNEKYENMVAACGEYGVPYASGVPYSGLGFFMSRFMGVENTIYALIDAEEEMKETIDLINKVNLKGIKKMCESSAEVVIISDNLSSDVQSPDLFNKYSSDYYTKAAALLHQAGKFFAVHLDGRIRGLLECIVNCNVDIADALTSEPTGDMTPAEIREEGGKDIVLAGGVSPVYWLPDKSNEQFRQHVKKWLDLKEISPRLIMSDGDQTPPGTQLSRIKMMKEIVEEYGRYY